MNLRKSVRRRLGSIQSLLSLEKQEKSHLYFWLLNRPPNAIYETSTSLGERVDDAELVARIMDAYKHADKVFVPTQSFWDHSIRRLNLGIHDALLSEDVDLATSKLSNPASNALFWGFDTIAQAPDGYTEPHEALLKKLAPDRDWKELYSLWLQDRLLTLAEAVGARKLHYPESPRKPEQESIDIVLDKIQEKTGVTIDFPNPYPGEFGLKSSRGIINFRSIQALYQAWRIKTIRGNRSEFRVLEIGAGLGRTAYYAYNMGIENYSILDLPLTGAAQSYFLGRTLGPDKVRFFKEKNREGIEIIPAGADEYLLREFDLVVNIDSLTEMDTETRIAYANFIKSQSKQLFSVNHDENEQSVSDLFSKFNVKKTERFPYWLRRGYIEEHLYF